MLTRFRKLTVFFMVGGNGAWSRRFEELWQFFNWGNTKLLEVPATVLLNTYAKEILAYAHTETSI